MEAAVTAFRLVFMLIFLAYFILHTSAFEVFIKAFISFHLDSPSLSVIYWV
jgi:hypothetical protein